MALGLPRDDGTVAVLGAGAMGSLFAGALTASGVPAVLLGRPSPHFDAIQSAGLRIVAPDGAAVLVPVAVATSLDQAAAERVRAVIVLVKAWATEDAMRPFAHNLPPSCLLVSLQNGLGNREAIRRAAHAHDPDMIVAGVTSEASLAAEPGTVHHAGYGETRIGFTSDRSHEAVVWLCESLSRSGLPAAAEPGIDRAIWTKLAVNAGINGVTALAGAENGRIASDAGLAGVAIRAAKEVADVARALGVDPGDVESVIVGVARATAANRSSMLRDLEMGRRTEREAIYGAITERARTLGIDVPVCETLGALVGARERSRPFEIRTRGDE